jgi:thiol-disulfide isomerase/thioredoxin
MKRILVLLMAIFIAGGTFAQGIKFEHGQLQDALKKAKKENKLVFVDCYTKSCGPCKMVATKVFPLPKVGKFYNENFINYKLDLGDESLNGPKYAEKYGVRVVPTFLFLKPSGEVVFRGSAMDARTLILMGKKALGENVTKFYTDIFEKYESGDRSEDVICDLILCTNEYIPLLNGNREKIDAASNLSIALADTLFANNPEKFLRKKPFQVLKELAIYRKFKRGNPVVETLIKKYHEAKKNLDETELSAYLTDVNFESIKEASKNQEKNKYEQYIADVNGCLKNAYAYEQSVDNSVKFLTAMVNSEIVLEEENYDKYLDEYTTYLTYNPNCRVYEYFAALSTVSKYREPSKAQLEKCLKINQMAFEKYDDPSALGFIAVIMTRLGRGEEAKSNLEKCIKLMKEKFGEKGEKSVKYFKDEIAKYSK